MGAKVGEGAADRAARAGSEAPIGVAVIDSGAHVPHPHLPAIAGGVAFDLKGERSDAIVDRLGHGTAAAAAIHEKAPDAELHIVKVFDRQLATTVPTLIRAIDWSIERGVRVVNLSLGTPHDFREEELRPVVERAVEAGVLVVSAYRFDGQLWYPGSMAGAVGVVMDASQDRDTVRTIEVGDEPRVGEIEAGEDPESADTARARARVRAASSHSPATRVLRASPYPRPVPGVPPERNLNGISFAVANASGCLAARLVTDPDIRTAAAAMDAFLP